MVSIELFKIYAQNQLFYNLLNREALNSYNKILYNFNETHIYIQVSLLFLFGIVLSLFWLVCAGSYILTLCSCF